MTTTERPKVPNCGTCTGGHATVAQARLCSRRWYEQRAADAEGQAQAAAELETERRYERWLEDGGASAGRIQYEAEQDRAREQYGL